MLPVVVTGVVVGLLWSIVTRAVFRGINGFMENKYGFERTIDFKDLLVSVFGVLISSGVLLTLILTVLKLSEIYPSLHGPARTFWGGLAVGAVIFRLAVGKR